MFDNKSDVQSHWSVILKQSYAVENRPKPTQSPVWRIKAAMRMLAQRL